MVVQLNLLGGEIKFKPLSTDDFGLLLKWLELPHIKQWWDPQINWTKESIEEKYKNYVLGFKRLKIKDSIIEKPMHAFVIYYDDIAIGYVQYYNKYDFPPEQSYDVSDLPKSCAALDYYIGELDYIGKGLGTKILNKFIEEYIFKNFDNVFVDPETENIRAIRVYEKSGFKTIKLVNQTKITTMIKSKFI